MPCTCGQARTTVALLCSLLRVGCSQRTLAGPVDEHSPVSESPGALPLLSSEEIVRDKGGVVLRFAGLYDVKRGGHAYWMKAGVVRGNDAGLINQVHYDDAAAAVVAALECGPSARGELALVADG